MKKHYNIAEKNGRYKDGRTARICYCKLCDKKISNYQHKFCVDCQHKNQEIIINKQDLIKFYINKQWSAVKIGHYFKCSKRPVLRLLKKYKIHIRTRSENQSLKVGDKSPLWKGKIHREYFRFNDNLKNKIRERNNYQCQICFGKFNSNKLDVHHIDLNRENIAKTNLVSLCETCHYELHFILKSWRKECQK